MFTFRTFAIIPLILVSILAIGCTTPGEPEEIVYSGGGGSSDDNRGDDETPPSPPPPESTQFLKNVVFDHYLGDLNDPEILAAATRGNLLVTDCSRFFGQDGNNEDLAVLRAANPDMKIIGFFRSKTVRLSWGDASSNSNTFTRDLYEASVPFWSYTTTGDTLQDWPNIANFSTIDPAARKAMRDVFVRYQDEAPNKLDGVFWDYFNFSLWISPDVHTMEGEPDLDGDGVVHWDDPDELAAYMASEEACIEEMRAVMGDDFIQIANGTRALQDASFAALVDGMFYERFPNVGFNPANGFAQALDPNHPNNLWAAHEWPRTQNGGPWLILSNKSANIRYFDEDYAPHTLNLGELNRAVALLTGGSSVYYDQSGTHNAGFPSVELDLGQAVGEVVITGDLYEREFERGRIALMMGGGNLTDSFTFEIHQDDVLVQSYDFPRMYP